MITYPVEKRRIIVWAGVLQLDKLLNSYSFRKEIQDAEDSGTGSFTKDEEEPVPQSFLLRLRLELVGGSAQANGVTDRVD